VQGQEWQRHRHAGRGGRPDRHRKQGYGPVTIAGHSQPIIGDVTADIGGSAITSAVTGNVSKAIASLGKTWSRKNVAIG
jgi:hypothetical protein